MYSVTCVGNSLFFYNVVNITSDVLLNQFNSLIFIRYFSLYAIFKVQLTASFISHQKLKSLLISNHWWTPVISNSTSLLIGLAVISCCSSLPVSMPKDFVWSFHTLVGWYFRFLGEVLSNLDIWSFIPKPVFFLFLFWRPPTLPHRLQCSTIGRSGLNHRVRDGYGCFPWAHRHQKGWVLENPHN